MVQFSNSNRIHVHPHTGCAVDQNADGYEQVLGPIATLAITRCDRLQTVQMLRSSRCSCHCEMVGTWGQYRAREVYAGESPPVRLRVVCISATPVSVSATSGITAVAAGPAARFGGEEASSPLVSERVGIGHEGCGDVAPAVSRVSGADAFGATRGGVWGGVIRRSSRTCTNCASFNGTGGWFDDSIARLHMNLEAPLPLSSSRIFLPEKAECPKSDPSSVNSEAWAPIRTARPFSLRYALITSFQP